mmetsp:Transcript_16334/g.51148  ORF Transcript_16334/g.51148 Transcript_16334/m.51148 type:complete len:220 (+) Transcript_16334:1848-2507(+)
MKDIGMSSVQKTRVIHSNTFIPTVCAGLKKPNGIMIMSYKTSSMLMMSHMERMGLFGCITGIQLSGFTTNDSSLFTLGWRLSMTAAAGIRCLSGLVWPRPRPCFTAFRKVGCKTKRWRCTCEPPPSSLFRPAASCGHSPIASPGRVILGASVRGDGACFPGAPCEEGRCGLGEWGSGARSGKACKFLRSNSEDGAFPGCNAAELTIAPGIPAAVFSLSS